jgi:hypothetical protein
MLIFGFYIHLMRLEPVHKVLKISNRFREFQDSITLLVHWTYKVLAILNGFWKPVNSKTLSPNLVDSVMITELFKSCNHKH